MAEELAVAALFIAALGSAAEVLALIGQPRNPMVTVCPNCSQPFDVSKFPAVWGIKLVTCPRCLYTW